MGECGRVPLPVTHDTWLTPRLMGIGGAGNADQPVASFGIVSAVVIIVRVLFP